MFSLNTLLIIAVLYFIYSAYKNSKELTVIKKAEGFINDITVVLFLTLFSILSANEAWTCVAGILFISTIYLYLKKNEDQKIINLKKGIKGINYLVIPIVIIKVFIVDLSFIPSSSMRPTLKPSSVVVLNKLGVNNLPFLNKSYFMKQNINSGEIITFYSSIFNEVLIKRVIGKPGDTLVYDDDKNVYINGKLISYQKTKETFTYEDEDTHKDVTTNVFKGKDYNILLDPTVVWLSKSYFKNKDCKLTDEELTCIIPKDKYFVMGDNRDYSYDSRYFGFIDKSDIIGTYLSSFNK